MRHGSGAGGSLVVGKVRPSHDLIDPRTIRDPVRASRGAFPIDNTRQPPNRKRFQTSSVGLTATRSPVRHRGGPGSETAQTS